MQTYPASTPRNDETSFLIPEPRDALRKAIPWAVVALLAFYTGIFAAAQTK